MGNSGPQDLSVQYEVVGSGSVTVPAGTYSAWEVVSGTGPGGTTSWYVDGIGPVWTEGSAWLTASSE